MINRDIQKAIEGYKVKQNEAISIQEKLMYERIISALNKKLYI